MGFYRCALLPIQEIGNWDDQKLTCIRAQIKLSSTLVCDCEMSTGRRFLRGIPQPGGRTTMMPMPKN